MARPVLMTVDDDARGVAGGPPAPITTGSSQ